MDNGSRERATAIKAGVRARVAHVFGVQINDMGGTLVRTDGLARAKAKIGMKNLAYNEEDQELIRRINCPTNAPPRPAAPYHPVPGVTAARNSGRRGRTLPRPGGTLRNQTPKPHAKPLPEGFRQPHRP